RLGKFLEAIVASTDRTVERWTRTVSDQPVDIVPEMAALTIEIVSRALFGSSFGTFAPEGSGSVWTAQLHLNRQILHLITIPDRLPTPENLRFPRALQVLDGAVCSILEGRRAQADRTTASDDGRDLLSILLESRDEDTGEGMSDLELRDEVMTIFLAGHETTANALNWIWHFLSLNPEVEERLHAEVDQVLGGRAPCLALLPKLQYTRMVLDESLRLCPPVWAIGRFALTDDVAGGYRIPAHSTVLLSPYVTHRHPEYWESPECFDPERFRPALAACRPRFAYFPF